MQNVVSKLQNDGRRKWGLISREKRRKDNLEKIEIENAFYLDTSWKSLLDMPKVIE